MDFENRAEVEPSALVQTALRLGADLDARRSETAALGRLPDATLADLSRGGLISALVPKACGGSEARFQDFFDIVQALGRSDGSVAWTYAVLACGSWMVGTFFTESVSHEVFASDNPLTSAVMAPTRIAVRQVAGGVMIDNAEWTFNTGIRHAGWNIVGFPIFGPEGRPIDFLSGIVPTTSLIVVDDWDVIGLKGSGSCTVRAKDLFIPSDRIISHHDLLDEKFPTGRASEGSLYNMPIVPTVMVKMASPSIAIARGALDRFIAAAGRRHIAMTFNQKQSDATVTHLQVAEAAAKIDAAETITRRSISELEASGRARSRLSVEQKARIWRDAGFASRLAWEAVDVIGSASGGSFVRSGNEVMRSWLDVRAATAHAGLNPSTTFEIFGRVSFGLPSNSPLLPG